jgi:PilZ domain
VENSGAASSQPGETMEQNRRRVPRFPFVAFAEVTEQASGGKIKTQVSELSLYGCYVDTINPLPEGTAVSLKIFTDVEFFEARATVVYAHAHLGMGMTFRDVKPHFLTILKRWLVSALQDAKPAED